MNPRRLSDPLFRIIVGAGIWLAVLHAGLILFRLPDLGLAAMPFFVPMIHGFAVLETFTIAFLALGRNRAQRNPFSYWVGIAFLSYSITNTFYILAWPGLLATGGALIGHLADTPSWIIMSGQLIFASLLITAGLVRRPAEKALKGRDWLGSIAAWLALFLLINILPLALEGRLPAMVRPDGTYTPLMLILNAAVALLYATGAIISTRQYRRSADRLSGYLALDLLLLTSSSVESFIAGQRYALLWYACRVVAILGGLIMMVGLLWEYIRLYHSEQEKSRQLADAIAERERAETALRELNTELERRVAAQTTELRTANEALELHVAARTAEIESVNKDLKASRLATLNLLEDTRESQKQVEQVNKRLRESEARYHSLFNSMTEGFALHEIICDEQGRPCDYRFLDVNPAFETLTGLKQEQVVGKTHNEVLPNDNTHWLEVYGAVALSGEPVHFEDYSAALEQYYEVFAYRPVANQFAVIFMNITERKRSEEALRESESRSRQQFQELNLIYKSSPVGLFTVDRDLRYVRINEQLAEINGKPVEEHLGRRIEDVLPELAGTMRELLKPVLEEGTALTDIEVSGVTPKNPQTLHYWLANYYPIKSESGEVTGLTGAVMEITERKWMENELQKARAEAEQHANELDTIFNSITDGIIVYGAEGRIQRANQAAVEMLGFDPSDENMADLAKTLSSRNMDGELLDLKLAPSARALRGEIVVGERFIIQNPRGQDSIVVASASPLWAGGGIAGAVAIWQDVTDQHKAEETQAWLASFPELNPNPIVELDRSGMIYYLNPVARGLFPDLETRGTAHPWLIGLEKILADFGPGKSQTVTHEVQVGEAYYLQSVSYVPQSGRARIYGFDISKRKEVEEELRQTRDELELRVNERTHELAESNTLLQSEIAEHKQAEVQLRLQTSAMEAAANGFIITDHQGTIQWCNPAFAQVTGYTCEEVIGLNPRFLKSGRHDKAFYEQMWQTLLNGQVWQGEMINRRKDGSLYTEEQVITPVRDEQGQIAHFIAVKQDISARKQAEEALRLANAYNRSLLEASLDPLVTITPEGKIGDVNSATEKVTGRMRQELIGTDFHSYFSDPEKARAGYQKVFENGSVRDYELEIRHKDGHVAPVLYNASLYRDETGQRRGVFAVARDITDRKQFEAQLVQAEKHAVIGRMVGSVTHEINNPLQTIKNCLYLIQQDTASDSPIEEPLEMATSETARLTDLVGQLRELYRPRTDLQEHPNELLDILEEVHALLTPHLNNSKVHWEPLTGLTRCYINCVRDQILEVFLNISMNAIEAMQARGGTLSVNMNLSGEQVGVVFKDSGPGISADILPHLFEPFMTTKSSGLGLGLSICYGIIQRHGGQIVVENCPDGGAAFTIWMPVARKSSKE